MRLALYDPAWDRPCSSCEKWHYEKDGSIQRSPDGTPCPRGDAPTPCMSCPKVPTWAKSAGYPPLELRRLASEISEANARAYEAYLRFKAVGRFPDDSIVDWYSGLIRQIEDGWNRRPMEEVADGIETLLTLFARRR